jgi:tetratricopeptide (TPR) repeat protein
VLFELVTADIVVADISTANPNVFYELGIRHGVRPRGTLLINGQWNSTRPFDIAPDRAFTYDGRLFVEPAAGDRDVQIDAEKKRFTAVLNDAWRDDRQVESSPLYAQLGGLKPVDWTNIQTSRAKYFGSLQDDWMERVKLAQAQGYPGHILTLAEDAPTRFHREKLLFEAAKALINLGRFEAAEQILEDLLDLCPDHDAAQLQLGLVLARLQKTEKAELHMRRIELRHKDHPEAGDIMGQVYRDMWRLRWCREEDLCKRQKKAIETSQLAAAAIQRYYAAQRCHPEQYFNGFNVLILLEALSYLSRVTDLQAAPTDPIDTELTAAVRFACRCAHENAVRSHNHTEQFWTLTTAAGLEMLAGNSDGARQNFRDACNVPDATVFEFQTIRMRLELLQSLGYSGDGVIDDGISIVDEAMGARWRIHCACNGVYVFAGCVLDSCTSNGRRFEAEDLAAINEEIVKQVRNLGVSSADLAITGLCHLSDIMFAEACKAAGAQVRLLIPRREQVPLLPCKGFEMFPEWEDKAYKLIRECNSWYQDEHLGAPPDGVIDSDRNRRWITNTARMEEGQKGLHALLIGSRSGCSDAAWIEKEVRRSGGEVRWIPVESGVLAAVASAKSA